MTDEYELGGLEFGTDFLIPCLPVVGLIAIPIGLIDMRTRIPRYVTQGRLRVTTAVVSHAVYLLAMMLTAV